MIEVLCPADGRVVGTVPNSTAAEVPEAFEPSQI